MPSNKFNSATSLITFILALIATIAFWYFIYLGDVYDNWYPLIGHAISAHGALIGIVLWQYLQNKKITFIDWISTIFNRKK